MTSASDLVIGVDGGGTKTLAFLAPLDDVSNSVVLGRGAAGPGNPRAAGFEVAQANIAAAIEAAFSDARLPRSTAAAACFCLAGAGRESEQQEIAKWASEQQIAKTVRVTGDAEPILAAASPDNVGIALICGTGSLAWGRGAAGKTARCGGWGYLLGDEGGAYWIVRAALTAAMRAADGRGEMTALLPRFQKELQASAPHDLVDRIYSKQMSRDRMAGLAHVVFDSAERDATARQIITDAASELAAMIDVLRRHLDLPTNRYILALAGSVILNEPLLRELVLQRIPEASPGHVELVLEPPRGAVALARALAKKT